MSNDKCVCEECGWQGSLGDQLHGVNPFDTEDKIYGCPRCKTIDRMYPVCDEPDCWKPVTCGSPTPDGYRSTCGKHRPKENACATG